jgi:hypothetical protein
LEHREFKIITVLDQNSTKSRALTLKFTDHHRFSSNII